jgi:hypothetical protein
MFAFYYIHIVITINILNILFIIFVLGLNLIALIIANISVYIYSISVCILGWRDYGYDMGGRGSGGK